jgi:hypothetical protein
MRQTTNDLLFQLEECRRSVNECEIVRAKIAIDSPAMLRLRDLAVARLPVRIVLYWGAWRRNSVEKGERVFLDRLGALSGAIQRTLDLPCSLCIVATDTHARMEGAPAIGAGESPEEFVLPSKWQRVRAMLTLQAGKLFADADERAAAYELANLREGGAMLRAYPTGIFLHTGLPELRPLLCSLPMIHIYTGPNRKTRKPWFEGGDETSAADTAL